MHHLCKALTDLVSLRDFYMSNPGKVFALHRIKPHAPPLVRPPSIPLSFSLAWPSPGGALNALAAAQTTWNVPHLAPNVYGVTTRVSTLFAPHACPQRQFRPRDPPSPPVFLLISAHFTATPGIPVSLPNSSLPVSAAGPGLSPRFYSRRDKPPTSSLRPIIPTTLAPYVLPRLLARSWPVLLLPLPSLSLVGAERGLQPEGRHPSRGVAASGFRPLCNIPHCCLR